MKTDATLTKREAEIAELLAWGAAKKEVACTLYISTRTVENTTRNIYDKIGIQKATELCVWWFCSKCGVSWDLSPVKRTVSIIVLFFFIQSNVIEANESKRYFRSRPRYERIVCRRLYRDEDVNDFLFD
ncbi:MAG: LuxR C-terminal-related transcriptional regulator [Candidatus Azobacteroides sp.]|nr:LuxR C-terminal-related transcriptional regulator [Candidatus Azobacteroides sp.]